MKKLIITNATSGLISVAYKAVNGQIKFVDLPGYSLSQEVFIDEADEAAFMECFERYGSELILGKVKDDKVRSINEKNEEKRIEKANEYFEKEIKSIETAFTANDEEEQNSLVVSKPQKKTKK